MTQNKNKHISPVLKQRDEINEFLSRYIKENINDFIDQAISSKKVNNIQKINDDTELNLIFMNDEHNKEDNFLITCCMNKNKIVQWSISSSDHKDEILDKCLLYWGNDELKNLDEYYESVQFYQEKIKQAQEDVDKNKNSKIFQEVLTYFQSSLQQVEKPLSIIWTDFIEQMIQDRMFYFFNPSIKACNYGPFGPY